MLQMSDDLQIFLFEFEAIVMKYDKEEVSEWIYVHVKINRVVR